MADLRPPRTVGGERETLLTLLRYHRESLVRKVAGVGVREATWSPVGSGTSLLWLVKHLTGTELSWFLRRFAGQSVPLPDPAHQEGDTIESAVAAYRDAWARVAPIIEHGDLDEVCQDPGDGQPQCNLRWVLAHLVEETARHAGHADIIRELVDGATGR
ncbi:DinB family protein [Longispora sp. K20-0274]|uniref:DinB family protein n=1 Tax=Longispora sp. K20-0274 TaxID=3088255 RepID=UPI003999D8BE